MLLEDKNKKRVLDINREHVLLNISIYLAEENLISREEQMKMMQCIRRRHGGPVYDRE